MYLIRIISIDSNQTYFCDVLMQKESDTQTLNKKTLKFKEFQFASKEGLIIVSMILFSIYAFWYEIFHYYYRKEIITWIFIFWVYSLIIFVTMIILLITGVFVFWKDHRYIFLHEKFGGVIFIIGILFGAALGVGTYMVLTDQQQTDTAQCQEELRTLNEIIDEKESEITQLERVQQELHREIDQLRGTLEETTDQIALLEDRIDSKETEFTLLEQEIQDLQQEIDQLQFQLDSQTGTPEGPTELTIFHINDLHGRVLSQDPQDGISQKGEAPGDTGR